MKAAIVLVLCASAAAKNCEAGSCTVNDQTSLIQTKTATKHGVEAVKSPRCCGGGKEAGRGNCCCGGNCDVCSEASGICAAQDKEQDTDLEQAKNKAYNFEKAVQKSPRCCGGGKEAGRGNCCCGGNCDVCSEASGICAAQDKEQDTDLEQAKNEAYNFEKAVQKSPRCCGGGKEAGRGNCCCGGNCDVCSEASGICAAQDKEQDTDLEQAKNKAYNFEKAVQKAPRCCGGGKEAGRGNCCCGGNCDVCSAASGICA